MIQGALTRLFTAAMNWLCWVCIWAICMPAAAMASLASLPLDSVSLSAPPSARSSWIATSARPTTSLLREANSGDTCPCHYHATGHPALLHRKAIQTTGRGVVLVLNLSGWQMVLTTAAISSGTEQHVLVAHVGDKPVLVQLHRETDHQLQIRGFCCRFRMSTYACHASTLSTIPWANHR